MASAEYIKSLIARYRKLTAKGIRPNSVLQQLYDSNNYYDLLILLEKYNLKQTMPYLASGISGYFNEQISEYGLSSLKLSEQDREDCKFIASCFGKNIHYSDNDLSPIYTTLLGTTELNYGMQTFPAGIFEDVFQCSVDHSFPIQPIVGESEPDFYCRILDYQISQSSDFPVDKKEEALSRAKRLANNFCVNKNRVYLIPMGNVLQNKASFGDVTGLRDGTLKGEQLQSEIDNLPTFSQLLNTYIINQQNVNAYYNDPNMNSEYGIAIYGPIQSQGITYFEIDRKFDLIQKRAKEKGLNEGEIIPDEIISNMYDYETESQTR